MSLPAPSIELGSGFQIGYGTPLAGLDRELRLSGGTHFLVARNGRGKTTLLRTLARTLKQLSGTFRTQGYLQYLPEDLRFDPEIPAKTIFRSMLPSKTRKAALALAEQIELDVAKPYGRLSTGNRRKTSLILAEFSVQNKAGSILLLDEPFSGLDAFARQAFENLWRLSGDKVLRLVSCHPDYDDMPMPSTLLITNGKLKHIHQQDLNWSTLKQQLN
ncbi:MAG: ATP-binding cassette domain-containing protein [Akkermansiaceae bacterium]|nr:ATP-binding cassette domain-containing protein [Akkermansiaceae bacterium]MCF7733244.1 ATP-binding cassette domain-containing protein [Akkermansiaceae bacterium]